MNNTLSLINNKIQHSLFLLDNDYFRVAIIMALVLYCSLVVTVIPRNIANLFNNMVFKICMLVLVIYISFKDTTVALLLAIALILSIQTVNKMKIVNMNNKIEENEQERTNNLPNEQPKENENNEQDNNTNKESSKESSDDNEDNSSKFVGFDNTDNYLPINENFEVQASASTEAKPNMASDFSGDLAGYEDNLSTNNCENWI